MRVAMGLAAEEDDRDARAIERLQLAELVRLHELNPDAVQRRHACDPSCPRASSPRCPTICTASMAPFKTTPCCPSGPAVWATTGPKCAALGSYIKGTNGKSQGVVPFLKVVNDTAVAVNQGGKRKGAVCAYLESWHLDIEECLELRKNTGDDRRPRPRHEHRELDTRPVQVKRVAQDGDWTLFTARRRTGPARPVRPGLRATTL